MEQWTRSLPSQSYWGGHGSLTIQSTCVLWTERKFTPIFSRGIVWAGCYGSMGYRSHFCKLFGLCISKASTMFAMLAQGRCSLQVHVELHQGYPLLPILFVIFMYRSSRHREGHLIWELRGSISASLQMWFCWFLQAMIVNLHWVLSGSQLSVKCLGWKSALPNQRPWFSTGNGGNGGMLPLGREWVSASGPCLNNY